MKTIQKIFWGGEFPYEAPSVELIEVAVEQGFAVSPGEVDGQSDGDIEPMGWVEYGDM